MTNNSALDSIELIQGPASIYIIEMNIDSARSSQSDDTATLGETEFALVPTHSYVETLQDPDSPF